VAGFAELAGSGGDLVGGCEQGTAQASS